jgi:anti-sigma-K factor RskA
MSDDVHRRAAAFALDALDDDERERFDRHLPTCETCQSEVNGFTEAAAALAGSVAEPAPAALRESILQAVDQTRQVSVLRTPARRRRWLAPVTMAAALIALVGTLGFALSAQHRANDLERVAAVTAAPDARTTDLKGTGQGTATLRITYSPSVGRSVVVGADMPAAPDGKTYQLWFVTNGTPQSAGVFEPNDKGTMRTVLGTTPSDGQIVALTIEPDGGSTQPTTTPIFAASVAA